MSSITIEYPIPEGQSTGDAYDAARDLIAVEAAQHPDAQFGDPVWQDLSNLLIATVHYNGELTPDEPVVEEPKTCVAVKKDGEVCGRNYPCFYHPASTLIAAIKN